MATVGRAEELETIAAALRRDDAPIVLVEGDAGIGKSTVWRHVVDDARAWRSGAVVRGRRERDAAFIHDRARPPGRTIRRGRRRPARAAEACARGRATARVAGGRSRSE